MMKTIGAILWRQLHEDGHDACRLIETSDGWRLDGAALFNHAGEACRLTYDVRCDAGWRTQRATVSGWLGARDLAFDIARHGQGHWRLNGVEQPRLDGLVDVDLAFTPATNLIALRRFDLAVGAETQAPAAWLIFPELRLERLDQTYRRLSKTQYRYSGHDYEDAITVDALGFVTDYPRLWVAQTKSMTGPT